MSRRARCWVRCWPITQPVSVVQTMARYHVGSDVGKICTIFVQNAHIDCCTCHTQTKTQQICLKMWLWVKSGSVGCGSETGKKREKNGRPPAFYQVTT